jgi:deazaflavin-dependent oxidoreductase (nitroreductase family)
MKNIFIKWFMAFNKFLLTISKGQLGSKLGKQDILILHTIGRKSGVDRGIPIAYFNQDNRYLIVASNWGQEQQASWYLNLQKEPHARLEVKGKTIPVTAREALGEEYGQLWKFVTTSHPPYLDYQKQTSRRIPIMIFE